MKKMKLIYSVLLFIALFKCYSIKALILPDTHIVVQQIRYYSTESKEIYLTWGINDWKLLEDELRPEGTFVKENIMHTPMQSNKDGIFFVNLKVRPGTKIDYKFRITKGLLNKEVEVWDTNSKYQKDYHTIVLSDNIVLINSKVKVRPDEALTVLDFSMPFLSISCSLLLMIFIIKQHRNKREEWVPDFAKIIFSGGLTLFGILALIRASLLGFSWDLYIHPFRYIPKLIWAGFYDLVYIGIICGIFYILNFAFGKFIIGKRILISLFIVAGIISVLSALMNLHFVKLIGEPLSSQTAYLLHGGNLLPELTAGQIISIISVCCSCIFTAIFLSYLSEMLIRTIHVKHAVLSSIACACFVYFTIAPKAILHYSWDYDKISNPVISYFENKSILLDNTLFTLETSDSLKVNISKNTGPGEPIGVAPQ